MDLLEAMETFAKIAAEAREHWDADADSKVGKLLKAMAGDLPGYRADIDAAHKAIARMKEAQPMSLEEMSRAIELSIASLGLIREGLDGVEGKYATVENLELQTIRLATGMFHGRSRWAVCYLPTKDGLMRLEEMDDRLMPVLGFKDCNDCGETFRLRDLETVGKNGKLCPECRKDYTAEGELIQ